MLYYRVVKVFLFIFMTGGFEARLKSAGRCTVSSTGISGVRRVAGKKPARDFWTESCCWAEWHTNQRLRGEKNRWISYATVEGNQTNKLFFFNFSTFCMRRFTVRCSFSHRCWFNHGLIYATPRPVSLRKSSWGHRGRFGLHSVLISFFNTRQPYFFVKALINQGSWHSVWWWLFTVRDSQSFQKTQPSFCLNFFFFCTSEDVCFLQKDAIFVVFSGEEVNGSSTVKVTCMDML